MLIFRPVRAEILYPVYRLTTCWTFRVSCLGRGKTFPFSTIVQMSFGPSHPTIQGIPGFFPGVKQPGREADHSLPSSTEMRNEWSYTATPTTRIQRVAGNNFLLPSGPQQARVLTITKAYLIFKWVILVVCIKII
jgi:hypothetical protein